MASLLDMNSHTPVRMHDNKYAGLLLLLILAVTTMCIHLLSQPSPGHNRGCNRETSFFQLKLLRIEQYDPTLVHRATLSFHLELLWAEQQDPTGVGEQTARLSTHAPSDARTSILSSAVSSHCMTSGSEVTPTLQSI